jgi:hypothetical protein
MFADDQDRDQLLLAELRIANSRLAPVSRQRFLHALLTVGANWKEAFRFANCAAAFQRRVWARNRPCPPPIRSADVCVRNRPENEEWRRNSWVCANFVLNWLEREHP